MDVNEYQRLAKRTECVQGAAHHRLASSVTNTRLNHALIGLMGEVGELACEWEKHIHYGQPLNRVRLVEELGDMLWYIALACNALGMSMERVLQANINKLRIRYPERYSDERAAHRDLVAEEQALNMVTENDHA